MLKEVGILKDMPSTHHLLSHWPLILAIRLARTDPASFAKHVMQSATYPVDIYKYFIDGLKILTQGRAPLSNVLCLH
jgi:hypothetical protein